MQQSAKTTAQGHHMEALTEIAFIKADPTHTHTHTHTMSVVSVTWRLAIRLDIRHCQLSFTFHKRILAVTNLVLIFFFVLLHFRYTVEYRRGNSKDWVALNVTTDVCSGRHCVSGLNPETLYMFRLSFHNEHGTSEHMHTQANTLLGTSVYCTCAHILYKMHFKVYSSNIIIVQHFATNRHQMISFNLSA